MARFSIASLLRWRRTQKDHAAADPAGAFAYGTVVSSQGLQATIGGLDVVVGDVVAISGWEAIKGPRQPGCYEAGVEAQVVAVNGAEATVVPLVGGWTPLIGTRVVLSRHGGLEL